MERLYEIANVRQIAGEPRRRWFSSLEIDLIIWTERHEEVVAFQLCYDKSSAERAVTWRGDRGFDHALVDNGETALGGYKGTPLLVADGHFAKKKVHRVFLRAAADIPEWIRSFVSKRLLAYPLKRSSRPSHVKHP